MKAIQFEKYGAPNKVLALKEVEKPTPKKNEVRIKIKVTTVNDYDWSLVRGKPFLYRMMFGITRPKNRTPGMELAGLIEAIGADVKQFQVGDAVFGDISEYGFGTFAEYVCINENAVIKKPITLSFEQAVSIPHAATLAFQALQDLGSIKKGQKVLINGGGGGVGTIGCQLAKNHECEVTGVDANSKLDMMRAIGFDQVLDYKKVNFTKSLDQYDLILDCKSNKSALSYRSVLKPNGRYISIGGQLGALMGLLLWGKFSNGFSSKKLKILALKANKDLEAIAALFADGAYKCEIDGPHPLMEAPKLIQYFGDGEHKGKIVIEL